MSSGNESGSERYPQPMSESPEACDGVFVESGRIREVNSYYDSVTNRAALDN